MTDQYVLAPVYQQFTGFVKKGFAALNEEHQEEVKRFIKSCKQGNGMFTDRAGTPDYYYSLFGTWLSLGVGLIATKEDSTQFTRQYDGKFKNPIDEFASLLIKASLPGDNFDKPSYFYLLKRLFLNKSHVSFFYRLFLFVLIDDAIYRKKWLYTAARWILIFTSPPAGAPCSIQAAYIVGRHETGLDTKKEQKILLDFFVAGKGFKAFMDIGEVDLLSTAVALFALKTTGADLRKIAPDCLELIQQNYDGGAFLAGNGDQVRDLEYTFYGLLALGILV